MEPTTVTGVGSPVLNRTSNRTDAWWLQPAFTVSALVAFGAYTFWAAWQNAHFHYTGGGADYLSPFYSPHIPASWFAALGIPQAGFFRNLFSPAFFILWMPLGFRLTCYYYRKAYYRSFFMDPVACAVREAKPSRKYTGETRFPFVLQNMHRYFFYLAILVMAFLTYDLVLAFLWEDAAGGAREFGIGVGTLVMLVNVVLLGAFTFGCNSARHIVGGQLDCFSCDDFSRSRFKGWKIVSVLNKYHMLWAWVSMFSVGLADLYIRLASMGVITDLRLF